MFGIKTKVIKKAKSLFISLRGGKLTSDITVRYLMGEFSADTYGHRGDIDKADLGYGWIHYGLIRTIKPKRVLCVGSRHGYIPAILAQACKDNARGHVDFVDPGYGQNDKNHWTGVGLWKTEKGQRYFDKFGLGDWITLYVMISKEFAERYGKRYEYIYLDGDHSYKGVSLDYKLFWPRLEKYGFMVFHDIDVEGELPEGVYGVHKLWKKVGGKNAIKFPFKGSGLGILQK